MSAVHTICGGWCGNTVPISPLQVRDTVPPAAGSVACHWLTDESLWGTDLGPQGSTSPSQGSPRPLTSPLDYVQGGQSLLPLPSLRISLKGHPSPEPCCGLSWGCYCNRITVQFLHLLDPAHSFTLVTPKSTTQLTPCKRISLSESVFLGTQPKIQRKGLCLKYTEFLHSVRNKKYIKK